MGNTMGKSPLSNVGSEKNRWLTTQRFDQYALISTRAKPLLFSISCTGFYYMHYTTHGTNGFTSHPKDEAMVKCLA